MAVRRIPAPIPRLLQTLTNIAGRRFAEVKARQQQRGGSLLLLAALLEPCLDQLFDDDVGGASAGYREAFELPDIFA
jgi:hypothetical protein